MQLTICDHFSQRFTLFARKACLWCIDFAPQDHALIAATIIVISNMVDSVCFSHVSYRVSRKTFKVVSITKAGFREPQKNQKPMHLPVGFTKRAVFNDYDNNKS
jgi:hypothetical protein